MEQIEMEEIEIEEEDGMENGMEKVKPTYIKTGKNMTEMPEE
jgi:hypothetical protein